MNLSRTEWVRLACLISLIILGVLFVMLMAHTEAPTNLQLPTLEMNR